MKIIVFVKQVPDTSEVRINPETNNLIREGVPSILNPFDENGMELALRLKEQWGGSVTAVSMGPPQAGEVLQYCLDMGADEAFLITDKALGGSDTLATGYLLSAAARAIGYDCIICGAEAIDGCTGQVGPIIAENLDIPQLTYVGAAERKDGLVYVTRETGNAIEYYQVTLPVLLCVRKGINDPRDAAPSGRQVEHLPLDKLDVDRKRLGLDGSPTRVVEIHVSDTAAKSYVEVDDSLSAEERIRTIIDGGIPQKEKVSFVRGPAEKLIVELLQREDLARLLER